MEGRNPPPPADHPFVDDPKAINKKFWGTQAARGFFRFTAVVGTIWMGLLFLNGFVTRHEKRLLGFSLEMTPEQFKRRLAVMQTFPGKTTEGRATFQQSLFPDKNKPEGFDVRFDDSVKYRLQKHPKPLLERIER